MAGTASAVPPPVPTSTNGNARDSKPCSLANALAFHIESQIDRSDHRHVMLMPATWMIDLNGSLPAQVITESPRVITSPPTVGQHQVCQVRRTAHIPRTFLNGTRNAMWQKQPPRNGIMVPRVYDYSHVLIQQITADDLKFHSTIAVNRTCGVMCQHGSEDAPIRRRTGGMTQPLNRLQKLHSLHPKQYPNRR